MGLISAYIDMLNGMVGLFGATHNIMHIHAGMAVYLGAQLVMRNRRASPLALAIVVTLELVHEAIERLYYGSWRWPDTGSDILLTIMWPAIITVVGLYRRHRWAMMEKLRREQERLRKPARARPAPQEAMA